MSTEAPPAATAAAVPALSSAVLDKYKAAGDIASKALQAVIAKAEAGANILSLCQEGDKVLEEQAALVYNKAKVAKGISFPTTISVNQCAALLQTLPLQH